MVNAKITELAENTTPAGADLVAIVDDVGGSPSTQKITLTNLANFFKSVAETLTNKIFNLADNTLTGTAAEFDAACSDDNFVYTSDGVVISGGALGTPSSGTLTNCTGLPQSGVTNLTTDLGNKAPIASPTFTGTVTLPATDLAGNDLDNIQNLIHDISTTTVALDFANEELQTITASATTTFTCSAYVAGKTKVIKILDDGSGQTLAFPAGWIFVGTKPTAIAAGKTGILTLTCWSTTEASVTAGYAEQE